MAKPIVFAAQARAEVNAAAVRYGDERPELKAEFISARSVPRARGRARTAAAVLLAGPTLARTIHDTADAGRGAEVCAHVGTPRWFQSQVVVARPMRGDARRDHAGDSRVVKEAGVSLC